MSMFFLSTNPNYENKITGFNVFTGMQTSPLFNTELFGNLRDTKVPVEDMDRRAPSEIEIPEIYCTRKEDCEDIEPIEETNIIKEAYCNRDGLCAIKEYPSSTPENIRPPCIVNEHCGFEEACINNKCVAVECNEIIPCPSGFVCLKKPTSQNNAYECTKICESETETNCISENKLSGENYLFETENSFKIMTYQQTITERMWDHYIALKENRVSIPVLEINKEMLNTIFDSDVTLEDDQIDVPESYQEIPEYQIPEQTFNPNIFGTEFVTGLFLNTDHLTNNKFENIETNSDSVLNEISEIITLFDETSQRVKEAHDNLLYGYTHRLNMFDFKIQYLQDKICKELENFENINMQGINCETNIKNNLDESIQPLAVYYKNLDIEEMKLAGFIDINFLNENMKLNMFDDELKMKIGNLDEGKIITNFNILNKNIIITWNLDENKNIIGLDNSLYNNQEITQEDRIIYDMDTGESLTIKPNNNQFNFLYSLDFTNEKNIKLSIEELDLTEIDSNLPSSANTLHIKSELEFLLILGNEKIRTKEIWFSKELPMDIETSQITIAQQARDLVESSIDTERLGLVAETTFEGDNFEVPPWW